MGLKTGAAAGLTGCVLAIAVAGCVEIPASPRPLEVAVKYPPRQDVADHIPAVDILHVPRTNGYIRHSAARRQVEGRDYGGWRIEVARTLGAGAPAEPLFEIVARRFDQPEPHLDLYITSATRWQLVVLDFPNGKVRDGLTGREILWPYLLEPGAYNLKAVK